MTERGAARGQSTVEFALIAPLVVLCALVLVGTARMCLEIIRLDDIARNAVRSAVTADDPTIAASGVARAFGVVASTTTDERRGIVTVITRLKRPFPLPVLGRVLPPVTLTGSASMMREPPIVLG